MPHIVVPEAEALLDQEIKVLDHGFVRLVDYLGGDQRIVQAARVSYGAGTKSFRQDRGLIHYLLRNDHTSPFEQVQLTFHTKMPIFVARQWVRHRTARLNEISGRYSVMKDEFYLPTPDKVCAQSESNKQGRAEPLPAEVAEGVIAEMGREQREVYANYQKMLDAGVARELADMVRARAKALGVELIAVGIRDVILPGEMKDLMNKVTEAKKAAEANLIARREETATIRSQANTAKLLADNPTLMRLRELEVLEKVAANSKLNVVLGEKRLTERIVNVL